MTIRSTFTFFRENWLTALLFLGGLGFALRKSVNAAVIVLFLTGLVYIWRNRRYLSPVHLSLALPLVLLVCQSVLTLLLGFVQGEINVPQFDENLRYLGVVPAFFMLHSRFRSRDSYAFFFAFFLSIPWVFAEYLLFFQPGRFFSFLLNPNTAGLFSGIAVSFALLLVICPMISRPMWRLGLSALAIVGAFILLVSETRSSWVACLLTLPIVGFSHFKNVRTRLLALFALIFIAALAVTQLSTVSKRLHEVADNYHNWSVGLAKDTSVGLRLSLYVGAFRLAAERPLQGYGATELQTVIRERGVSDLQQTSESSHLWQISGVHNHYMDRLLTHGILGAILAVLVFLWPVWLFLRFHQRAIESGSLHLYAQLLFGAVVGLNYFFNGLSLNYGYKYVHSFMALAFMMSLLAVAQLQKMKGTAGLGSRALS